MTPERAVAAGALALFGEKYGDEVRVVSMGGDGATTTRRGLTRSSCAAARMSRRTGDIGLFKIVGESAVAAGVRRIEALTGAAARCISRSEEALLRQIGGRRCSASPAELPARLSPAGRGATAGSSASWPRRGGALAVGAAAARRRQRRRAEDGSAVSLSTARLVDDVPAGAARPWPTI